MPLGAGAFIGAGDRLRAWTTIHHVVWLAHAGSSVATLLVRAIIVGATALTPITASTASAAHHAAFLAHPCAAIASLSFRAIFVVSAAIIRTAIHHAAFLAHTCSPIASLSIGTILVSPTTVTTIHAAIICAITDPCLLIAYRHSRAHPRGTTIWETAIIGMASEAIWTRTFITGWKNTNTTLWITFSPLRTHTFPAIVPTN